MGFRHWVHLNEKGMKLYGTIFPDGIVPVKVMVPTVVKLRGQPHRIYKVDLKQLSKEQFNQLLELMSRKFGASKETIRKDLEKDGWIPLRADLVSVSGTNHVGLFI